VSSGATIVLAVPLLWEAMYRKIRDGIKARRGGALKFRVGMAVADAIELVSGTSVRKRLFAPVHQKLGGRNRLMISGGAGIDPEVVRGFLKLGFTFLQGYGLTEASPLVSVNRIGANRIGSVGPPMPEIDVRVEEPDEDGVGEILIKGPNIMLGYHNDPEETARVLDAEGWLRTGDFGYLDREGYLYITGRKKNVIVAKNGKNVYPEEIETKIGKSELILECMVFGRESKSKGEEIWAIVVPDTEKLIGRAERDGATLTREFAAEAVRHEIRHFNSTQPIYKHIANFIVRDEELPKTTTKKIRRREILREAGLAPEAVMRV
jgi:long-chain acyl-CoA synthetase